MEDVPENISNEILRVRLEEQEDGTYKSYVETRDNTRIVLERADGTIKAYSVSNADVILPINIPGRFGTKGINKVVERLKAG